MTIAPATPVGTGPFTYRIVKQPDPTEGTLTIDPKTGEMCFEPAPGFAGTAEFSYEIVDASGLASDPMPVSVEVLGSETEKGGNPPPGDGDSTAGSGAGNGAASGPANLAFTGGSALRLTLLGAILVLVGVMTQTGEAKRRRRKYVA